MRPRPAILLLVFALPAVSVAQSPEGADRSDVRNWFDDPFARVRAALPDCPVPLGPLQTAAQAAHEAHYRADRGTRCWQGGRCAHPNAYVNDRAIGDAVARRFAGSRRFARSSLWVTVKRGWVFVEGCVSSHRDGAALSAFIAPLQHVDNVVVNVMTGTRGRPPYAVATDSSPVTLPKR